jgi:hypothetical protein
MAAGAGAGVALEVVDAAVRSAGRFESNTYQPAKSSASIATSGTMVPSRPERSRRAGTAIGARGSDGTADEARGG